MAGNEQTNPVTDRDVEVIQVDPKGKYFISLDEQAIGGAELHLIQQQVREWWESDEPFLFLSPRVKLVKKDFRLEPIDMEK